MLAVTRIKNSIPPGRGRRVCLASFFIILLLMYCVPYVYQYSSQWNSSAKGCLTSKISAILSGSHEHDASVLDAPRSSERKLLPFIGNGNIGVAINYYKPGGIVLRHDPPWAFQIPYYPILNAEVEGLTAHSATVLHSKSGLVHHLQCYSIGKDCVSVRHTSFAHRTRKSVIMQQITIENQSPNPVTLHLKSWDASRWKDAKSNVESVSSKSGPLNYELISGKFATHTVRDFTTDHFVHVAIGISTTSTNIDVQPHGSYTAEVFTVVQYTEPMLEHEVTDDHLFSLVDKVRVDMLALNGMSFGETAREHTEAWKDIWKGEFVQEQPPDEQDDDDGTHSQELINTIMYYILSSVEAPLYQIDTSDMERAKLLEALDMPGSCYNGQPTLFMEPLWESVNKQDQLSDLVSHWLHTLYKSGCQSLLTVGADGVMQAMLLSFLGAQFTTDDLSFHADPHQIRGSLTLKNLKYGSSDIDIRINRNAETIHIQTNGFQKENSELFACETGCKTDPVVVGLKKEELMLKWTEPMTPFLYVSHDADHLVFLRKKVIHYRYLHTMDEVPLIVNHNKGIHVPVIFWVFIGILITIFHLFLIRLVYNEYCSNVFQERFRKKKTSSSI